MLLHSKAPPATARRRDSRIVTRTAPARQPQQNRSRASFERVLEAATGLLAEKGRDFTLADVSQRSKVSIGSIYGRVNSKEDLIRTVQLRVLERAELEQVDLFNRIRRRKLPLDELVPTVLRELAGAMRAHAPILRAFLDLAPSDAVIANTGWNSYIHSQLDFKLLLLERRDQIGHPEPERAVETCFNVVHAVLARYLGTSDVPGEGDWNRLIEDLGLMSLFFLRSDVAATTAACQVVARGSAQSAPPGIRPGAA